MDMSQDQAGRVGKATAHGRGFSKSITEMALYLELTGDAEPRHPVEVAAAAFGKGRSLSSSTLRRCASEARALVDHARASGALNRIRAQAGGSDWRLREEIDSWVAATSLPEVLKARALRLNRSRGGRPSSQTRTLRAVEALLEFARAGRADALDELRSIRALIEDREPSPSQT
jgi:hypothetical protein